MALSKNKIKYVQSLSDKKHRKIHGTFVAEGNKMVSELLACMPCQLLIATPIFLDTIPNVYIQKVEEVLIVEGEDIVRASFLQNPQEAIAVFHQPSYNSNTNISNQLSLALDGIQDPGNLGTIIRLADWYGIQHIFCSLDTVDIYNPKTVQASMGALARVQVHYINLLDFLHINRQMPIYGTSLNGENMYEQDITANGILVMGNEGKGIQPDIEELINTKLYIPNYPQGRETSESLNVAIATAIVCAEFRRRMS